MMFKPKNAMRIVRATLMLTGLCASTARADFFRDYMIDPDDGQLDVSRFLAEVPLGFLPVPSVITEPAVGYGLAAAALFFHESEAQREQRTDKGALLPENISIVGGGATENGTWGAALGHLGFWRQDKLRYRGFLAYGSINLEFYSLPQVGELPRAIELEMEGPFVFQQMTYRLPDSNFFVGARQLYRRVDAGIATDLDFPSLPPALIDYLAEHINANVTTSGLGLVTEFDSRDNPFNPESGFYYSANYTWFDDAIGSDVDYGSFDVSALHYWALRDRFLIGFRLQVSGVDSRGDNRLPPYVPPFIDLRGVPASRYQANRVAVAELQFDYKLSPRWKAGVFTGVGRAAEEFDDLGGADDIQSFGAGFRYLIARRYGFVMGLDIARGPDDTAVYIQAGSTW